ncbi:MAG: ABC transporter ATP-binding protein [Pseudomonadota bacterium]
MSDAALELRDVVKTYGEGETAINVLKGANLIVGAGEIVALAAPSGAGKSTLLHIAGLLDNADGGEVRIGGKPMVNLPDGGRTAARRAQIGFVYQFHHLLPEFSALENVVLPQLCAAVSNKEAEERATSLLTSIGLGSRTGHRPAELSGGEQQRVAICRALANKPRLLLADEPTGNLDVATSESVFEMLLKLVREEGLGALIATHNPDLAARMDRTVRLEGGLIS